MKNRSMIAKRRLSGATCLVFGLTFGVIAFAADPEYKADKATAEADYATAKTKCAQFSGNDKDVCLKQAKADYEKAKIDAKTAHQTKEETGG